MCACVRACVCVCFALFIYLENSVSRDSFHKKSTVEHMNDCEESDTYFYMIHKLISCDIKRGLSI